MLLFIYMSIIILRLTFNNDPYRAIMDDTTVKTPQINTAPATRGGEAGQQHPEGQPETQ